MKTLITWVAIIALVATQAVVSMNTKDITKLEDAVSVLEVAATNTPPVPPVKITWDRTIPTNVPVVFELGFGDDGLVHFQTWKKTPKEITTPKKSWWKR